MVAAVCAAGGLATTIIYGVLSRIAIRRAARRGANRPSIVL
jgi:hypothetical protein